MFEQLNGRILKLAETRVWRTYTGGEIIDKWHGKSAGEVTNFPEDWVASTTKAINPNRDDEFEGLSRVIGVDGNPTLKEIMDAQPENYFGKAHMDEIGDTIGTLIKLIDSAERLTIQAHPDKKFAKEYFKSDYGKTEAWYILDTQTVNGEEPCVYFGFKPGVTRDMWKDIFDRQDIPAMLDCLHKIPVKKGDSFFIAGGLPHAIGAGCFIAEVQEPTDFTMRTELITPNGLHIHENQCHQGLGYELMCDCFHYNGVSLEETTEKWKSSPVTLLKTADSEIVSLIDDRFTDLFTMKQIKTSGNLNLEPTGQLKTWIVLDGAGVVKTDLEETTIQKGDFLLIPASLEKAELCASHELTIIECLPRKVSVK
ncbi:MAG: type I phosphomannose isomerase catalytic subunit [Clostridia bacterium]